MLILGFQKTTLLDFPGKLASIVFTGGCNFLCPYCQNSELAFPSASQNAADFDIEPVSEDEVLEHLKKRRGMIEGLVITGGEPTLQKDLITFIRKVKELEIAVKLDTNGTSPETLKALLDEGLIDYAAIDIKHSPEKYHLAAGLKNKDDSAPLVEKIMKSIRLLEESGIDHEFRTTIIKELISIDDLSGIAQMIKGTKKYFMQGYKESPGVPKNCVFKAPSEEELKDYERIMKELLPETEVSLRGI